MGVSFWEWVQFLVPLALLCFGLFVLAADRLPGLAGAGTVVRKASVKIVLITVDRLGTFLLDAGAAVLRATWGLLLHLWAGPRRDDAVNRFADDDLDYVPLPDTSTSQDRVSVPPSVCLSAPSAPDRAMLPPAVERLMIDRSRDAALDGFVAAGWGYSQLRALLKNDSNTFRAEYDAAVARVAADTPARVTPIAGRETGAAFPGEQAAAR